MVNMVKWQLWQVAGLKLKYYLFFHEVVFTVKTLDVPL